MRGLTVIWAVLAVTLVDAGSFDASDHATEADRRAMKQLAAGRKGYVVWESRRPTGTPNRKYRIWKRNLDGTGLAMISGSAAEDGYAHLAPRISPDGRRVVFAGKSWNSTRDKNVRTLYNGEYVVSPYDAWIVEIDPRTLKAGHPRELKELRGRVGGAGEDHVFEWRDNRTLLVNLPAEQGIFAFDVAAGKIGRKLAHIGRRELQLSPSGKYFICAQGGGAAYGEVVAQPGEAAKVGAMKKLRGCQVSISCRDDWLFWMQRASVVGRVDLSTGRRSTVRLKPLLPRGHNYIYFPALSRDRSLLALGGGDMHSHGYGDYEIFLIQLNPATGKPIGKGVRYSFNDRKRYRGKSREGGHALDRWPDVWVSNPEFNGTGTAGNGQKSGPLAGLHSELLAGHLAKLKRPSAYPATLARFERYSKDSKKPERAAEARRVLAHLDGWADNALKQAAAMETTAPGEAVDLYQELRRKFGARPAGKRAGRRLAELAEDADFKQEYTAWGGFVRIRRLAAGFKLPKGAKPLATDRRFAKANAAAIGRIQKYFAKLQAEFPSTRATLEARSLVRRYAIAVRLAPPAESVVVAEIEAVVKRRSTPKTVEQIEPYTEAMLCTEYTVQKVLAGKLQAKRVIAVHVAMRGGKLLPPAKARPGQRYRLKLGKWSDQSHYQNHPIADDIDDLDATYYFVLAAERLQ